MHFSPSYAQAMQLWSHLSFGSVCRGASSQPWGFLPAECSVDSWVQEPGKVRNVGDAEGLTLVSQSSQLCKPHSPCKE